MDIYLLDKSFRPVEVFDSHISLSWIERFVEVGEVDLVVDDTPGNRQLFSGMYYLGLMDSTRVMEIKDISEEDKDGKTILHITGKSLENVLETRSVYSFTTWRGTASFLARRAFNESCVSPPVAEDALDFYDPYNWYGPGGIEEDEEELEVEVNVGNLLDFITDLCKLKFMGFRMIRVPKQSKFQFHIYTGTNRTLEQTVVDPVVFDPELDTLINYSSLISYADYRNVAYAIASDPTKHILQVLPAGQEDPPSEDDENRLDVYVTDTSKTIYDSDYKSWLINKGKVELAKVENEDKNVAYVHPLPKSSLITVLPEGVTEQPVGTERRQLILDPGNLETEVYDPKYVEVVTNMARQELAKHNRQFIIDGQVPSSSPYIYERDYFLGDVVSFRHPNGLQKMRVVGQVFAEDLNGEKRYPELVREDEWKDDVWSSQPSTRLWETAEGEWADE